MLIHNMNIIVLLIRCFVLLFSVLWKKN